MPRVKCYSVEGGGRFFVVIGSTGDHVTSLSFCTCADFNFRRRECVHMKLLKESIERGAYELIKVKREELSQIFKYEAREVIFEQPR